MGFWANFKEKRAAKKAAHAEEQIVPTKEVSEAEVAPELVDVQETEAIIVEAKPEPKAAPVVDKKKAAKEAKVLKHEQKVEAKRVKKVQKAKAKEQKIERAMAKSALDFSKDLKKLSKKYKQADDEFFEDLEEVLIKTDMGMSMVLQISKGLSKAIKPDWSFDEIKEALVEQIVKAYGEKKHDLTLNFKPDRLNIFLVVGVNGTGKTTSLAKLANMYAQQGYKVLIAAADTFRAGAVEQLDAWVNERLTNVDLLMPKHKNADPASVVYDALQKAQDEHYDLLLIDTAGRLQNKVNLMNELAKMHDIIHKFDKHAPHETLMIIDATTGQNGVIQAESFAEVTNVSGIILTKMDGTAKGGIGLAIKNELNLPIKLLGVGEQLDDLVPFDVDDYVYGLVADFMEDDNHE